MELIDLIMGNMMWSKKYALKAFSKGIVFLGLWRWHLIKGSIALSGEGSFSWAFSTAFTFVGSRMEDGGSLSSCSRLAAATGILCKCGCHNQWETRRCFHINLCFR
jgi:hypothetical protein